jgi:hypothetical protein
METPLEIRERWRYLRGLLITQLSRFESGDLQMHSGGLNVSDGVIARLKDEIEDFDQMIARSETREAQQKPRPDGKPPT